MAAHTAAPTEHYLVLRIAADDPADAAGALRSVRLAAAAAGGPQVAGVVLSADESAVAGERTLVAALFDAVTHRAQRHTAG